MAKKTNNNEHEPTMAELYNVTPLNKEQSDVIINLLDEYATEELLAVGSECLIHSYNPCIAEKIIDLTEAITKMATGKSSSDFIFMCTVRDALIQAYTLGAKTAIRETTSEAIELIEEMTEES